MTSPTRPRLTAVLAAFLILALGPCGCRPRAGRTTTQAKPRGPGKQEGRTYTHANLGLTMEIPDGWHAADEDARAHN